MGPDGAVLALQVRSEHDGRPLLREAALRFALIGAPAEASGEAPLAGVSNYIALDDVSQQLADVPRFGRVRYAGVYPGIDLVYYGRKDDGRLEYDFVLAPDADPAPIALRLEGQRAARIDGAGQLVLETDIGELIQQAPYACQHSDDGTQVQVPARFVLEGDRLAFALGDYDRSRPLVIDPVFAYATYIGGSAEDRAYGITVNGAGEAYVTGRDRGDGRLRRQRLSRWQHGLVEPSPGQPHPGLRRRHQGLNIYISGTTHNVDALGQIYVLKLNSTASQVGYSRQFGGTGADYGAGISVLSDGTVYAIGSTQSTDFPIIGGAQSTRPGTDAAVLLRADANAR